MCTELYLVTTHPETNIADLFRPRIFGLILFSILLHLVIYAAAFNAASYIVTGKMLGRAANLRLVAILAGIMFVGFFGRLAHVKEIYASHPVTSTGRAEAKEYVDKHYISWIFLS